MSITVQRKSGCKCITIAPTCHYPQWWHWRCVQRVAVRRKHILQDTLDTLKRIPWKATKYMKVAFIGEPGVDDGGMRQEFFRLLLESIGRRNMHFWGLVGRHIPSWQPTKIESFTLVKSLARWAICQVVGPIGFQESPKAIRLLNPQKPPTPGTLQDLFTLDLAHEGSNRLMWKKKEHCSGSSSYLCGEDGSLSFQDDDTQAPAHLMTLQNILNFVTDSTEVSLQACTHSDDQFQHHNAVSHCFHMFKLSIASTLLLQYKDVHHNIAFGIKKSQGFQRLWL